jgi:hypothetical protein
MFEELAKTGQRVEDPCYPGEAAEVPLAGRIGFRRESRSGDPTIDINATIDGVEIDKIKFVE